MAVVSKKIHYGAIVQDLDGKVTKIGCFGLSPKPLILDFRKKL